MSRCRIWFCALLLLTAACGDDLRTALPDSGGGGDPAGDAGSTTVDAGLTPRADAAAGADAGPGCHRNSSPVDRDLRVVVGQPYDSDGEKDDRYRVLELSRAGELTVTDTIFEMGRGQKGEIVFTPDGQVGVVAQEDGSLGVFRFREDRSVEVLNAGFTGEFYASSVVMDPSGDRVWVLETAWVDSGGGVYSVALGCDGSLTDEGRMVDAKLPYALAFLASGRALLASRTVLASPEVGNDLFLLDWAGGPAMVSGVDAYGDDDAIMTEAVVTADQRYVLVGDNSAFSGVPNRVAVVGIGAGELTVAQVLSPLDDPVDIVVSPHDDVAIVVNGFGNAIHILDYDSGNTTAPFSIRPGELTYEGPAPRLPSSAVLIESGPLAGHVAIAENTGVRLVRFGGEAGVTDLGATLVGSGVEFIVGAIGVSP